jgi:uncharacterized membrane protein
MDGIFAAIEQTPLSIWMREDPYAYFVALVFHAFGMALLVGGGIVISLRVLGIGQGTRQGNGNGAALQKFRGFFPVMWLGAVLAIVSGVLLLGSYPAKALTNPIFGIKFACLIGASLLVRAVMKAEAPPGRIRTLAALALALWLAGVAAGKLLLHTYSVLTVT